MPSADLHRISAGAPRSARPVIDSSVPAPVRGGTTTPNAASMTRIPELEKEVTRMLIRPATPVRWPLSKQIMHPDLRIVSPDEHSADHGEFRS